jgi:hypothetical protein
MPGVYHAINRSVATQHGNLRRVSPDWILAQGVVDGLGLGGADGRGCCRAWGWAGCWPAGRYGAFVARWRGLPFGAGRLLEDGEPVPPPCPAGDSEQGGVQARASCVAVVGIRTAAAVARATRPRRGCMSVASVRELFARMTIHGTRILPADVAGFRGARSGFSCSLNHARVSCLAS